jgi:hypothetical protein
VAGASAPVTPLRGWWGFFCYARGLVELARWDSSFRFTVSPMLSARVGFMTVGVWWLNAG